MTARPVAPLPAGFGIALDADTKQLDQNALFGGSPARLLRLSDVGRTALAELGDGLVRTAAAGSLARKLTDAGLAHPRPPGPDGPLDVTVVIPVRDRPAMLDRCLTALGDGYPVLIVDDGSTDPRAVANIAASHHARLLRRGVSGGPGVARNTGLAAANGAIVAFIDSDCSAPPGWIDRLAAQLADPMVAAVAPRIVALASPTSVGRFVATSGGLDLGGREARVVPASRVAYVPTAALVVRRSALREVAGCGEVFDPTLRYGEDVDLIWRLHEAGWRIRYDPGVEVRHHEPETWPALLVRRFHYGTSAGPLGRRHPSAIAPLVLQPWPTIAVAGLLARRPAMSALALAASMLTLRRTVRRAGLPSRGSLRATMATVHQTWLGVGRYSTQFGSPLLVAALLATGAGTRRRRWGRRIAAASLLLGPPMTNWSKSRSELNPVGFLAGSLANDVAYGAGVYVGCARTRTSMPLRPAVSWRAFRTGSDSRPGVRPGDVDPSRRPEGHDEHERTT